MTLSLLAVVALIISLASAGGCALMYRATVAARSGTPGEILQRMAELEQEWASTLESNARFTKRLAMRDKRAAEKEAQEPQLATNGSGAVPKAQLRAIALQRRMGA